MSSSYKKVRFLLSYSSREALDIETSTTVPRINWWFPPLLDKEDHRFMFINYRKAKTNIDQIFWPAPNSLCLIYIIYKLPMSPWRISTYWPTPVGIRTIGSYAIKFTHLINDYDKLYGDASIFLFRLLSAHKSSVKRTKSIYVIACYAIDACRVEVAGHICMIDVRMAWEKRPSKPFANSAGLMNLGAARSSRVL